MQTVQREKWDGRVPPVYICERAHAESYTRPRDGSNSRKGRENKMKPRKLGIFYLSAWKPKNTSLFLELLKSKNFPISSKMVAKWEEQRKANIAKMK